MPASEAGEYWCGVMIIFKVVKERHGWAVRRGELMTTPFWSRELAIREANCLADAIRCHGAPASVVVEGADPKVAGASAWEPGWLEADAQSPGRRTDSQ